MSEVISGIRCNTPTELDRLRMQSKFKNSAHAVVMNNDRFVIVNGKVFELVDFTFGFLNEFYSSPNLKNYSTPVEIRQWREHLVQKFDKEGELYPAIMSLMKDIDATFDLLEHDNAVKG